MVPVALWGLAGPAVVVAVWLIFPQFIQKLELQTVDIRSKLMPPARVHPRVVVVVVDDPSLSRFGRWPWPRSYHGKIITRLSDLGAASIALDYNFPNPSKDPAEDEKLIQSMKQSGKAVITVPMELTKHCGDSWPIGLGPEKWGRTEPHTYECNNPSAITKLCCARAGPPPDAFLEHAAMVGTNPATPDADGLFRRFPLFVRVRDELLPVLGLAAVAATGDWDLGGLSVQDKRVVIPSRTGQAPLRVPLDKDGHMIVNWAGPWGTLTNFSAQWLLDPDPPDEVRIELEEKIKGAICILGAAFTGGTDMRSQPYQAAYPMMGFHANVANTLLTGQFRTTTGRTVIAVDMLVMVLLAMALGFIGRSWLSSVLALLAAGAYLAYAMAGLSLMDRFVPIVPPLLAFALSFVAITAYRLAKESKQTRFLRDKFYNVIPPAILDQLLVNPDAVEIRGERRELTIMFTDIVGFTSISDGEEPEVIWELLTEYFESMTEIILRHGGTIDKLMGDGILAFWGAPISTDDHALRAVCAAVEMQRAVEKLNQSWEPKGRPRIQIRIGINTGYVSVGFFGSTHLRDYTVLGSNVNLAQRLEGSCRSGGILVSTRTHGRVKDEFLAECLGPIHVKGFANPVEVYELHFEPGHGSHYAPD